jgi:hypothetical protein
MGEAMTILLDTPRIIHEEMGKDDQYCEEQVPEPSDNPAEDVPWGNDNNALDPIADYRTSFQLLLDLEPDWDSYGGAAIDPDQLYLASAVLTALVKPETPRASIVPLSNGGVQIEWHSEGMDFEISTINSQRLLAYLYEEDTEQEWEQEITSDLAIIARVVHELTERHKSRRVSRGE